MAGVFISYRREDCAAHAGRLYDRLVDRFGTDEVFMDVDAIAPGVDFGARIEDAIRSCNVLIALIGDDWLDVVDATGGRRLDDPTDLVRLEIASALRRSDVLVIPVLVEGAKMPRPEQLPEDLKPLTRRNAFELSDTRWRFDVERLIEVAQGVLPRGEQERPRAAEPGFGSQSASDRAHEVTRRPAGDGAGAAPQQRSRSGLLMLAIPLVIVAGAVAAIIQFVGRDDPVLPDNTGTGTVTEPRKDSPNSNRLISRVTKRDDGLTLSVTSVRQTGGFVRVGIEARNNTDNTLTLPLTHCTFVTSGGATLEADPFEGRWTAQLSPGGERQRGTIMFEGRLHESANRASLNFTTVFAQGFSGPDNITVSGLRLR